MRLLLHYATIAGLIGLVVLHSDSFATIGRKTIGTFRAAVTLA